MHSENLTTCKACGSPSDVALASPETHPLARCRSCGLRSIADPDTVSDVSIEQSESEYFESYSALLRDIADRRLRYVRRFVSPPAKGLDFGASYGVIAQRLQDAGYAMDTFEKSPQALASMRRRGFHAYDELGDLPVSTYDLITSWHVLEHVPEPAAALHKLADALKPGGSIFVAVPNAESLFARLSFEHWVWTMPWHLHYFTIESLTKMFESHGLRIFNIHTDTGDVAALEILIGGILLRAPSRLARQNGTLHGGSAPSALQRIGAPVLRTVSGPLQQLAKSAGAGEEIVLHAVKA